MFQFRGIVAALSAFALLAAFEGRAAAQAPVRRDSAGIGIVMNGALDRAPRLYELAGDPHLTIGRASGLEAEQLHRVVGAVRARDGGVIIANAGSSELRVFDAMGRHVRSIGRAGRGPGEFTGLAWIDLHEDSLFAFDGQLRRVTVFAPDGKLARTFALAEASGGRLPVPVAVLRDGSVLAKGVRAYSSETPSANGVRRDTVAVLRYPPGGSPAVLAELRGDENFVVYRDGGVSVGDLIFGRSAVVAGQGEVIYAGSTDDFRIDVLDARGRRVRSIRSAQRPTPVRSEDLAVERERRAIKSTGAANPMMERMRRDQQVMFEAMPTPRTLPAFRNVVAGDDGRLWVEAHPRPSDELSTWAVFDGTGALAGTVAVRAGVTILGAGADYLLGRWRDELDVERVGLWKLER
jgi:hypothetical protein